MYQVIRPLLFRIDPESIHHLTLRLLGYAGATPLSRSLLQLIFAPPSPKSNINVFGLEFANPIGLAAGYDKDGIGINGLSCLGLGHLELGTVTLEPQPGNPRPRIFRLTVDRALINRMGFPNQGAKALLKRLERRRLSEVIVGVNIGKGIRTPVENAAQDYIELLRMFSSTADYIAINVSSPNTIGLRRLQAKDHLDRLLHQCALERESIRSKHRKRLPLLVKLAPDLSVDEIDDAIDVVLAHGIDGVIATNTTTSREGLHSASAEEQGGLSGAPLQSRSVSVVSHIHAVTSGSLPIIGVGGIMSGDSAKRMLEAGASLIQIYTGLVYKGPGLIKQILQDL